jgi:Protein of unknown function (DUF2510)
MAGTQRYWNGSEWTDHVAPLRESQRPTRKYPENDGLAAAGYVFAILFPIIGAAIGIALMGRKDSRGGTVLILSAVVFVIGIVVISAASATSY